MSDENGAEPAVFLTLDTCKESRLQSVVFLVYMVDENGFPAYMAINREKAQFFL